MDEDEDEKKRVRMVYLIIMGEALIIIHDPKRETHVIDSSKLLLFRRFFDTKTLWNPVQLLIDAQREIPFALLFFPIIFP